MVSNITVAAEEERGNHASEFERRHRLELFLGNTHEDGENGFTSGLTFEYRLTKIFGVGIFLDYIAGDFDKWAAGLPLFIHPYKGWRFSLSPGLDDVSGENDFLFKAVAAYEFEFDSWSITPEFQVDFIEGGKQALTYGVSVGYGF